MASLAYKGPSLKPSKQTTDQYVDAYTQQKQKNEKIILQQDIHTYINIHKFVRKDNCRRRRRRHKSLVVSVGFGADKI